MGNISEKAKLINEHLSILVQKSELSNSDIISIIENLGGYLNLKSISDYAKSENITYNGALKRIECNKVQIKTLFDMVYVIDNE